MNRWLGMLLFVVVVLGPIGVGAFMIWRAYEFERRAVVTDAKVVGVDRRRNQQTGDYEPVATVVWKDANGASHSRDLWSSGYAKGDSVTVRYDPEAPGDMTTGGGATGGVMVMTIGLVFLVIVVQAWWRSRAAGAKPPA